MAPARSGASINSLKASTLRAIKRAEEVGPPIFTGEQGLREVAKKNGIWDWALVGPDADHLRLAGGGPGGVEELRDAMGKHAHAFGLLRMDFGSGLHRYIFIHTCGDIDNGHFTAKERGHGMLLEPRMLNLMKRFAPIHAKAHFACQEDASTEALLNQLRRMLPMDDKFLTAEALQRSREMNQASPTGKEERRRSFRRLSHSRVKHWEVFQAPRARAASADPDMPPERQAVCEALQRRKVKLYAIGDIVEVFSISQGRWTLDGEVSDVVDEACIKDKFRLRAGSMKVHFENATKFKWVAPEQISEHVRPSPRVKPPPAISGRLDIEVHLPESSEWVKVHVEVNKGFLQWWETEEDARRGSKSRGVAYLLGLQLNTSEVVLKVRTDATRGALFVFRVESDEEAQKWTAALWEHAGFCEEMRDFVEAKQGGSEVRQELLRTMAARRRGGA